MKYQFEDKGILITGGSGSIGEKITKEILKYSPKVVRIFDMDEMGLFNCRSKFKDYSNVRYLVGNIRDKERVRMAVEDIDIIYHAAALKHVFFCEYNPFEALQTNLLGTQNVIKAALDEEVEKVIFTSSDKAVNSTNVMGATKFLAEKLIVAANFYRGHRKTAFSCVRFGNVFDSRGSVLSIFLEQISKGGPITVTDPKMTRYIMTAQEAVDFLFNATELAQGGEIFVTKMKAIRILDLARVMINEFSFKFGYNPEDIIIKTIGKNPGEKLYEELLTFDECERASETEQMFIILPEITEITDILNINFERYPEGKPLKGGTYQSSHAQYLTEQEIKSILNQIDLPIYQKAK